MPAAAAIDVILKGFLIGRRWTANTGDLDEHILNGFSNTGNG